MVSEKKMVEVENIEIYLIWFTTNIHYLRWGEICYRKGQK